jgi:hypothetical protein
LRHVERLLGVLNHKVAYGHVAKVAESGATSVGRRPLHNTGPGFHVCTVLVVVGRNLTDCDIFKDLELVLELADTAECHTGGSIERAVFNQDVCAVFKSAMLVRSLQHSKFSSTLTGFEGNIVVAVVNDKSDECDIRGVDCVSAIGVEVVAVFVVVEVGIVDVYVLHEDLARIDQRHRPHLALDKLDALDYGVGQTIEGDLMRPPGKVANCSIFVVPICVPALARLIQPRDTTEMFRR